MKNNIAKEKVRLVLKLSALGAAMISSGFMLSPAMAQDKAKLSSVKSIIDEETVKSISHQNSLYELRRQAEIKNAEAELKKAELEVKRTETEISNMDRADSVPGVEGIPGMENMPRSPNNYHVPEPDYQRAPKSQQAVETSEEKEVVKTSILDKTFVTRSYGLGEEKKISLVIDGASYTAGEKDVVNGVMVEKIHEDKAIISYKGEQKTAYIVSNITAAEITSRLNRQEESASSEGGSGPNQIISSGFN